MSVESAVGHWLNNVLLGIDELGNAISGGEAGETISSRTGRTHPNGILAKLLGDLQDEHCLIALESTPWGVPDPHDVPDIYEDVARDWDYLDQVMKSPLWQDPNVDDPMSCFTPEVREGAERAAKFLRVWLKTDGPARLRVRRARDAFAGAHALDGSEA